MSLEICVIPEVEIKGLLITGIFMLAGLALSLYLSLRTNAAQRKLGLSLACATGYIGFFVGDTVRSILYHDLGRTTAMPGLLSPLFLLLIAYAAVWVVCSYYVQYRRQGKAPELASPFIRELVGTLVVVAVAVLLIVIAMFIWFFRG